MSKCKPVSTPKETKAASLDFKRRKVQDLQVLFLQDFLSSNSSTSSSSEVVHWCEDHECPAKHTGFCAKCEEEWISLQEYDDNANADEGRSQVQPKGGTSLGNAESKPLSSDAHAQYRTIVGQLMWVCAVRGDLSYSVKELARRVSAPTFEDWKAMLRILRYVRGTSQFALHLEPNNQISQTEVQISACADSDWAGCHATRRSTSGGTLCLDDVVVHHWSRTQPVVALSSGEAEYYSLSSASVECLHLQNLLRELGYSTVSKLKQNRDSFDVYTDSNAARSMAVGGSAPSRAKHIEIKYHFLKDLILLKKMTINIISSVDNPADLLTKGLPVESHRRHIMALGLY